MAEKVWKDALKVLEGECPAPGKNEKGEVCGWCEGR